MARRRRDLLKIFLLSGEKTGSRKIHEESSTRQRWAYRDRDQGMLEQTRQFYVDLYTDKGIEDNAQETMLSKITSKLTKTLAELCEGEVTHDEITEAV